MKTLSVLFCALFLASCVNVHPVIQTKATVHRSFKVTPEGWWMLLTDDQAEVAGICEDPGNPKIIGCARWPDKTPLVYPVKDCFMGILTNDDAHPVEEIIAHELRHCNEGNWHPE